MTELTLQNIKILFLLTVHPGYHQANRTTREHYRRVRVDSASTTTKALYDCDCNNVSRV